MVVVGSNYDIAPGGGGAFCFAAAENAYYIVTCLACGVETLQMASTDGLQSLFLKVPDQGGGCFRVPSASYGPSLTDAVAQILHVAAQV